MNNCLWPVPMDLAARVVSFCFGNKSNTKRNENENKNKTKTKRNKRSHQFQLWPVQMDLAAKVL